MSGFLTCILIIGALLEIIAMVCAYNIRNKKSDMLLASGCVLLIIGVLLGAILSFDAGLSEKVMGYYIEDIEVDDDGAVEEVVLNEHGSFCQIMHVASAMLIVIGVIEIICAFYKSIQSAPEKKQPVTVALPVTEKKENVCSICGAAHAKGATFCKDCGNSL